MPPLMVVPIAWLARSGAATVASALPGQPSGDVLVHRDQEIEVWRFAGKLSLYRKADRNDCRTQRHRKRARRVINEAQNSVPEAAIVGKRAHLPGATAVACGPERAVGAVEYVRLLFTAA